MKLLRTIRFDPSDTFVFDAAAEPGEWAVSGAFMFADVDPAALEGKARAAFRAGLLGVASFGWSTLAQIVEASEADRVAAVEQLAQQFVARLDAPSLDEARAAAAEEIAFASSLCQHPAGMLIAVYRNHEDAEIHETFRSLRPREGAKPARAFSFLEVEGEEGPGETVDLAALARGEKK
jgi:hypothetical protein